MSTETMKKGSITLRLNGGTHATTGNMILKACSLGKVVPNADKDKVLAVVGNLGDCLALPVVAVERSSVSVIQE